MEGIKKGQRSRDWRRKESEQEREREVTKPPSSVKYFVVFHKRKSATLKTHPSFSSIKLLLGHIREISSILKDKCKCKH